ncbi:hypothetical protein KC367_g203 [Hortaea werneckii]|nr:hypothetical protein KC367_g203 [Hortaea werneckii]
MESMRRKAVSDGFFFCRWWWWGWRAGQGGRCFFFCNQRTRPDLHGGKEVWVLLGELWWVVTGGSGIVSMSQWV